MASRLRVDVNLLLGGCAAQVDARELLEDVLVLRAQDRIALEGDDRIVQLVVRLELDREVVPQLRLLRMRLGLAAQGGGRRAARRGALEEVLEDVADAGRARADAEEDEPGREDEGEEHEHPLRVDAQPREEELVFPALVLDALRLRLALGRRLGYASMRLRAALAMLRTSCHALSPCL